MPENKKDDNVKKFREELEKLQNKYSVVVAPVLTPSMSSISAELKIFTKDDLNQIINNGKKDSKAKETGKEDNSSSRKAKKES
jgi:hypothetical protein